MINRINMIDRLAAVNTTLTGVSQLMMMLYEELRQNGVDGERIVVMNEAVERCRDELDGIKQSLQECEQ